jgi:hypothetical protein
VLAVANTAQTNASLAITLANATSSLIGLLDLVPGDHVRHKQFGEGVVLSVDGTGIHASSLIEFSRDGTQRRVHHNTGSINKIADPSTRYQPPDDPADPGTD